MKIRTIVIMAGAAMRLCAWNVAHADEKAVVVYFENCLELREEFMAKKLADQMFASASVRILWRTGAPSAEELELERPIVVRFSNNTPDSEHPGALAFAVPYEGTHINIFYDRVRTGNPRTTQVVLAHVLVHEITHILQGIVRHSATGVMKAHWSPKDYTDMAWQPLSFTPGDIDLIQRGLAARAALTTGILQAANSSVAH